MCHFTETSPAIGRVESEAAHVQIRSCNIFAEKTCRDKVYGREGGDTVGIPASSHILIGKFLFPFLHDSSIFGRRILPFIVAIISCLAGEQVRYDGV